MKLVVQNVESALVKVVNDDWSIKKEEKINKGVLIYFWVSKKTTNLEFNIVKNSLDKFVDKFPRMRRLKNKDGRLDATLDDINWEILVVSNFTLYASNKNWTKMDFQLVENMEKPRKFMSILLIN